MKKHFVAIPIVLLVILITGQSFYSKNTPKKSDSTFLSYPSNVSMCGIALYKVNRKQAGIQGLKGWGSYKWKVTTSSDSAQYYFNQGISLYYGFHAIEAVASFEKAVTFDPSFAMGWYGKALALGPTINEDRTFSAPSEALTAALKSWEFAKNATPLERDLIAAMQKRYSTDTLLKPEQLRKNYAIAMKNVYALHQNNPEAVTLYADALLLLHPWDLYYHNQKPKSWTPEIRMLLEHAISISPKHPGANHYYIHTMEASGSPELALKSANLLDTMMPLVSHITHMPAHIYVRTGDYNKGVKANDAALKGYAAYLKSFPAVQNGAFLYEIHALHLQSSCAQLEGNYTISIKAALKAQKSIVETGALSLKGAVGNYLQYAYAYPLLTNVRFGKWDKVLSEQPSDTLRFANILLHFSKGMAYSRKHHFLMAGNELKSLRLKMNDKFLKEDAVSYSTAFAISKVAERLLSGVIAEEQGNLKDAVKILYQAVAAEDSLTYNEPKDWPLPTRQYLGNALLKKGNYAEAVKIFKADLAIYPKNSWGLVGFENACQKTSGADLRGYSNKIKLKANNIRDTDIQNAVF